MSNSLDIRWPYETVEPASCPECRHKDKVDASVRYYWNDSELELKCRKCFHQWTLKNVEWQLAGKTFENGERVV